MIALVVPFERSGRGNTAALSDTPVRVTMDDGSTFTYKLFAALLKSQGHYCDAVLDGNTWLIQDGMVGRGRAQPSRNNKPFCAGFKPVVAVYCRVDL